MDAKQLDAARYEARYTSSERLAALIADGPEGLAPELWEILTAERDRRKRQAATARTTPLELERRYPALRAIATITKVLAIGWIMAGCLLAYGFVAQTHEPFSKVFAALCVFAGALGGLFNWAAAESIIVILDIEENTRAAAAQLASR